jgi:hypothetical protein
VAGGELPEFVVEERVEFVERLSAAGAPLMQQTGDIRAWGRHGWFRDQNEDTPCG